MPTYLNAGTDAATMVLLDPELARRALAGRGEIGHDELSELVDRAEVGAGWVRLELTLGFVAVMVVIATMGLVPAGVVMLVMKPARFVAGLVAIGPWLALAWLGVLGAWRLPAVQRVRTVRARLERGHPDAVVSLRRLSPEEPRPTTGGNFGSGAACSD